MSRVLDHIYIILTIIFTVYSQLIMRWQVPKAGALPSEISSKINFILELFLNPWIISSIAATFLAGISWMLVMTKFEISYAYPWVSLNFILMLSLGVLLFGEFFSFTKFIGTSFVVVGIVLIARS
jgi:multidrug transporter EmrE-like cation transporter